MDMPQGFAGFSLRHGKVIMALQIEPELGVAAKETREPERGIFIASAAALTDKPCSSRNSLLMIIPG